MRRRLPYSVGERVFIKRHTATGAGVHVYYNNTHIGIAERNRMRDRAGRMMTVWVPINNGASVGAPKSNLREAVERIVRVHEIHTRGYATWPSK